MLHTAREARNFVAHEAVDTLKLLSKGANGFERWREVMASKLQDITLGKIIVAVLLSGNIAEAKPTKDVINAYRKEVEWWVLRNAL